MPKLKKTLIAARKQPMQARSAQLVEDILEAAVRVLRREDAHRFTTVRVAEEAGVSVGSLYQYFPSKEALLFRLQANEWTETWSVLDEILADTRLPPLDRVRKVVLVFFRSEQQEAALRVALDDAGALFRDTPEARALGALSEKRMNAFFEETLPHLAADQRTMAARLVFTTMSAVAEKVTSRGITSHSAQAWARASADMVCAYLERLRRPVKEGRKRGARG